MRFEYFDSWALTRLSSLAPAASLRGSMSSPPDSRGHALVEQAGAQPLEVLAATPSAAVVVRSGAGIAPDLTIPRNVVT